MLFNILRHPCLCTDATVCFAIFGSFYVKRNFDGTCIFIFSFGWYNLVAESLVMFPPFLPVFFG